MNRSTASRIGRLARPMMSLAFALLLPAPILAAPANSPLAQESPATVPAAPASAQVIGVSTEAEAGTLTGPISVDAADGVSFVRFGVPQNNPPPPSTAFQPSAPYYGTFYYPWFKNAAVDGHWGTWNSGDNHPSDTWFSRFLPDPNPAAFDPWRELYSARDPATIYWQLRKMAEAKIEFAVSSWWGQGKLTDENFRLIITDLMNRADNPYPNLRWTLYYEEESEGDPTVEQIVADLNYIADECPIRV